MSSPYDVAVIGGQVVVPPGAPRPLTVAVCGERIAALLDPAEPVSARRVIDATGKWVLPGIIDPHTHIPYVPGRGMPLDEMPAHFRTETASALLGGVTTLLCTYRHPPPYHGSFAAMVAAGAENAGIDFSFSLGITNDRHLPEIERYYRDYGVTSFKFYMHYRGDDHHGTGTADYHFDDGMLYTAMRTIAGLPGAMAMVHPENVEVIARLRPSLQAAGRTDLAAWTESRPAFVEAENVRRALYLAEQAGCPLYIPHTSSRLALAAALEHRARRTTPVYIETCPHYLTHACDSPLGLLGKVNPPLRGTDDQAALWAAVGRGDVDCIGTDHCGLRRQDKGPDIWSGTPGFPGMATMLPALMAGVRAGRLSPARLAVVTSYRAARLFGLYPRKGTLLPGSDADLVIVDPHWSAAVTAAGLHSRSDFTLYEGQELTGWPVLTMVRGQVMMADGRLTGKPGHGRYVARHPDPADPDRP